MNLPNKLTILRILLVPIMVIIPFFGIKGELYGIPITYLVIDFIFIIASITDKLDGYLARKNNQVTELGKMLDAIADKILVNPVLIIFAAEGIISPIVPVIIVIRDIVVNAVKMEAGRRGKAVAAIKSGKIKTAALMIGIVMLYIGDVPFIFKNIRVDLLLIYFATFMSLISMVEYITLNKKVFKEEVI